MSVLLKRGLEMDEACRQPTAPRLEDAALAFGKAGKFELGQGVELALEEVETGFDLARGGTEGRGVGGDGIAGAARVAQERFASRRVGDAPGGEERLGLARAQGVRLDGVGEAALLGGAEGAESDRGARGQASGVEARGRFGRELGAEDEATLHPAASMAEELAERVGRKLVLVYQRAGDARFVHGAGGLARGVGFEDAGLDGDAGGVLDDDRDVGKALGGPGVEALEAVEDLEGAVRDGRDADRQRGERGAGVGARAAQGGVRGAQRADGKFADEAHGRGSSTGRS